MINNVETLVTTIDDCLQRRQLLPALALLYTAMDVLASLERRDDEGVRQSFTRWVDKFIVQPGSVPCNALELYGARCGVLHTYTADSDLFKKGHVRQLYYAWGTESSATLQRSIDALGKPAVAIHVDELVDAFRQGVANYFDEIAADPVRLQTIEPRAGLWFCNLQSGLVRSFNTAHDSDS